MEFSPNVHALLLEQAAQPGMTEKQLAEDFKTSRATIHKWVNRPLGFVPVNGRPKKKTETVPGA